MNIESIKRFFLGRKCDQCGHRIYEPKATSCKPCRLKEEMKGEVKLTCPECSTQMNKKVVHEIIIDKCPNCKGIFLNKGELKAILKEESSDETAIILIGASMS